MFSVTVGNTGGGGRVFPVTVGNTDAGRECSRSQWVILEGGGRVFPVTVGNTDGGESVPSSSG